MLPAFVNLPLLAIAPRRLLYISLETASYIRHEVKAQSLVQYVSA